MRKVLVAAAVCVGVWYVFFAAKIDEADVRDLYPKYWDGFMKEDAKAICGLFHDDFNAVVRTRGPDGPVQETADRTVACENTEKFFATKTALEDKARTEMVFNVEYNVDDITIDPDGKSATARMVSEIRMGTEGRLYLKIVETQTDTIVGGLGGPKFLKSDGDVSL